MGLYRMLEWIEKHIVLKMKSRISDDHLGKIILEVKYQVSGKVEIDLKDILSNPKLKRASISEIKFADIVSVVRKKFSKALSSLDLGEIQSSSLSVKYPDEDSDNK